MHLNKANWKPHSCPLNRCELQKANKILERRKNSKMAHFGKMEIRWDTSNLEKQRKLSSDYMEKRYKCRTDFNFAYIPVCLSRNWGLNLYISHVCNKAWHCVCLNNAFYMNCLMIITILIIYWMHKIYQLFCNSHFKNFLQFPEVGLTYSHFIERKTVA